MIKKFIISRDKMLLILILIASILSIINKQLSIAIKVVINIVMICFLLKNDIKIIKSKLDICMIMLIISTTMPIIFNKYTSLTSSINSVLDYITLLWIYFLSRELLKNKSNVKFFKNALIFTTIFLIGIGIENITTNKFFSIIGWNNIANGENRLVSLLANPNTFASFIMVSYFISINEMIYATNFKNQSIYQICNSIFIVGIILTYSKTVYIIFTIFVLLFFLFIPDKKKKIFFIENILISFFAAVLYVYVFNILSSAKYYLSIWVFTLLWIEILYYLAKLTKRIVEYFNQVNVKKFIGVLLIIVIILVTHVFIALKVKKDFIICTKNVNTDYKTKIIDNIEANKRYVLKFTMNAKSNIKDKEDVFLIRVLERDSKSLNAIKSYEYACGNFSGEKEIEIKTSTNTTELKIEFETKYKDLSNQWSISKLFLNEKEIILEYKYLPTKLVNKISNINIHYRTFKERMHFWKDGLKLISKNYITGIGGDNWKYNYGKVQEYGYVTSDVHSYYIQIWLEFGIVGLVAVLGVVIFVISIRYKDKNQKSMYFGIQLGILALLCHSALDSDLYYINMKILLFTILGCLSVPMTKDFKENGKYIVNKIAILIISCVTLVFILKPSIYNKKLVVADIESTMKKVEENTEDYKKHNEQIAKNCITILENERDSVNQRYYGLKQFKASINSQEDSLENIAEQYYKEICTKENDWKYSLDRIVEKSNDITIIIKLLEKEENPKLYDWILRFADINIEEYEETLIQLKNTCDSKNLILNQQIEYRMLIDNYYYATTVWEKYNELSRPKNIKNTMYNLNKEFVERITSIQQENVHGEYVINSTRTGWKEILAVYMVCTKKEKLNLDEELQKEEIDVLRNIFFDINEVKTEKEAKLYRIKGLMFLKLNINIIGKTPDEIANIYNFDEEQKIKLKYILENYDFSWITKDIYNISGNKKIINVASSQIGNIGGEEYWRWYGYRERVDWCACFISWCANKCGYLNKGILPKFAICQSEGIDFFKACDLWREDEEYIPKAGDIIFFDWDDKKDGICDHVGFVEKTENGIVYTIEGNSKDECRRKSYNINSTEIMGYGTPMY